LKTIENIRQARGKPLWWTHGLALEVLPSVPREAAHLHLKGHSQK